MSYFIVSFNTYIILSLYIYVHGSLYPLIALGAGFGPDRRAQVGASLCVDVEGVDVGAVHVVVELQALGALGVDDRADNASFVPIMSGVGCLDEDVIPLWNNWWWMLIYYANNNTTSTTRCI